MNKKLNDEIKVCCVFSFKDVQTAIKHFNHQTIMDLGKKVCNEDGTVKHLTYMWDRGGRSVISCKTCGAIFLYQWSEYDGYSIEQNDIIYEDYFLVKNLEEAVDINNKYKPLDLEFSFKGLVIKKSDHGWNWNKENIKEY